MLYVIRHGETDVNKEGRVQGRNGLPLNNAGFQQAENLKEKINRIQFDYIFSSPQERAVQTAEIATGMQACNDERLNVFDLGTADGLKKEEVRLAGGIPDPAFYENVEDVANYVSRVFGFMKELEAEHGGKEINILICGHQCTTGTIRAYFEGMPEDGNILKLASRNGELKTYEF
ncbi:histidine phosphatase family protein [Paenibacillus sp. FSL H8-0282]|uniref:histidine phosphatase family protein n=1 Tax=unclassified Paenibacillus TaxID=185978 RepID=UPI0030D9D765